MQAEKPDRKAIERASHDVRSLGSPSWSAAAFLGPMKPALIPPVPRHRETPLAKSFPTARTAISSGMNPSPKFLTGSAVSEILVFHANEGGTHRLLTFHQTPRSQTC